MSESGESDHDHDFFDSMGGFQTMGILNALKTGDTRLDMLLAMCLPFVIRFLFDAVGRLEQFCHYDYWHKWWNSRDSMHHRTISYRSTRNPWGGSSSLDPDSQNTVLLKAIQLYLHSKVNLNLTAAVLNLTSTEDKHSSLGGYNSYDYDSDDEDSDGRTVVGILSKYKIIKDPPSDDWHQLGSYGVPASAFVELLIENHDVASADGKQKEHLRIFNFRSTQGHAIDAFVETTFDWYMSELRKLEDNSRFLYELKSINAAIDSNDDGENTKGSQYTRYRLSDEKTFESLFFREKKPLLNLIDNFRNRSGRYKVKGFPHKLGVLLHGPPGSGKTSLIKALAQHTGRSIVNVPLARISTNAELQSIFFDQTYHVQGQYVPVKLGYKDIIFVMEDVDAASKVVKRRDGKTKTPGIQIDDVELPLPKSIWQMLVESSESDCVELVKTLIEKSERLKEEALKPEVLQSIAKRMLVLPGLGLVREAGDHPTLRKIGDEAVESAQIIMSQYSVVDSFVNVHACAIAKLLESGAMVDDAFVEALLSNEGTPSPPLLPRDMSFGKYGSNEDMHMETDNQNSALLLHTRPSSFEQVSDLAKNAKSSTGTKTAGLDMMGPSLWRKAGMDQLNLTGILNVLDGVVDTPGRIVIMTTNHPEMLDPALIRPGRMDKKIYLGYMAALDVMEMLEHYFQVTLDAEQRIRVEKVIAGRLNVTPAQVEQLTAEYEDVEDMILALEENGRPPVSSSSARFDLSPKSVID
jgi:chaperone BCS1